MPTSAKHFWPELPYRDFLSTKHLLHMLTQMIGKLKLATPFEPHWANVPLWVTSQGLTSGPIPYDHGSFTIEIDLINHDVICLAENGQTDRFKLVSMSVATLNSTLFNTLHHLGIKMSINPMPQEVPKPIAFDKDQTLRSYDEHLANNWWHILASSTHIFQRYHAKFFGITPPIGLMWGTFDLRDARYINVPVPTTGDNAEYIRRNAMDVAQVEAGWWSGDDRYEKPAYYSFTYPQPKDIENSKIQPASAYWDKKLSEFILDYDDLRKSKHPEIDLLAFLESTYKAGATLAGWDSRLVGKGVPV